jgi:serine protease AprX
MSWIDNQKDRLDTALYDFLKTSQKSNENLVPVIIKLKKSSNYKTLSELCPLEKVDKPIYNLLSMSMFSGKLSHKTIERLSYHSEVEAIYFDQKVRAFLDVATPAIEATKVMNSYGLKGTGVTIAILDSGIYPHPDLTRPTNRIIAFKDFIQNRTTPYDDNGHGTHVAGCAASNGFSSSGKYKGPAPEANLVGVKVLDADGSGTFSTVIAGIDWCIQNRLLYNIKIMNLSLGAIPTTDYFNDPLAQAVRKAWRSGIVVCAAAGNSGPNGTINTPGFDPLILTIGAINDQATIPRSDDTYANYTSRGPTINGFNKPDVAAPGTNITSLLAPDSRLARQYPENVVNNVYLILSGTSMATPLCSGSCAQILQAYPTFTPDQLKNYISSTSQAFAPDKPGYLLVSRVIYLTKG